MLIMHIIFFHHIIKIVVAIVTKIVKMLQKHMDLEITQKLSS